MLVTLQKKAFDYLKVLESGKYDHAKLEEIIRFVQQDLCCRKSDIKELEDAELVIYLKKKQKCASKQFKKNPIHIVEHNQSLFDISQLYGIRLKSLYKLNNFDPSHEIKPGDIIRIR